MNRFHILSNNARLLPVKGVSLRIEELRKQWNAAAFRVAPVIRPFAN